MTADRRCAFEGGCDRPHHARGYCNSHYRQLRKGGPLRPLRVYGPQRPRQSREDRLARDRAYRAAHRDAINAQARERRRRKRAEMAPKRAEIDAAIRVASVGCQSTTTAWWTSTCWPTGSAPSSPNAPETDGIYTPPGCE
jgi:hypothetical protein